MSPAFFPPFFPLYISTDCRQLFTGSFLNRHSPLPFYISFSISLYFSPSLWGFTKLSHKAERLCFHIPADRHIFPSAHLRLLTNPLGEVRVLSEQPVRSQTWTSLCNLHACHNNAKEKKRAPQQLPATWDVFLSVLRASSLLLSPSSQLPLSDSSSIFQCANDQPLSNEN